MSVGGVRSEPLPRRPRRSTRWSPLRARVAHGTRTDASRRLAIRATGVGAAALAVGLVSGTRGRADPGARAGGPRRMSRDPTRARGLGATDGGPLDPPLGGRDAGVARDVAGRGEWLLAASRSGWIRGAAGTCGERRRASVGRVGTRPVADDASGGACGVACGGRLGGRGAAIGVRSAARRPTRGRDDHVRRADDVRRPAGRAASPRAARTGVCGLAGPGSRERRWAHLPVGAATRTDAGIDDRRGHPRSPRRGPAPSSPDRPARRGASQRPAGRRPRGPRPHPRARVSGTGRCGGPRRSGRRRPQTRHHRAAGGPSLGTLAGPGSRRRSGRHPRHPPGPRRLRPRPPCPAGRRPAWRRRGSRAVVPHRRGSRPARGSAGAHRARVSGRSSPATTWSCSRRVPGSGSPGCAWSAMREGRPSR